MKWDDELPDGIQSNLRVAAHTTCMHEELVQSAIASIVYALWVAVVYSVRAGGFHILRLHEVSYLIKSTTMGANTT